MPTTYEKIATTTLSSGATDITFSGIVASWTDLRIVLTATTVSSANMYLQINGDTATNYSDTVLGGSGTTAFSGRQSSASFIRATDTSLGLTSQPGFFSYDIFNYGGSTNKTVLITTSADLNGSGYVYRTVGLWRSTSVITSVKLYASTGNLAAGTTATLYGILKA